MALAAKLTQTATLWTRNGTLDWTGNQGYSSPTLITVRWVEGVNVIRDSAGQEQSAKHKVTLVQSVDEGDWLALGDWTGTGYESPVGVSGAMEIKALKRTRSVNGDLVEQVAFG